MTLVTLSTGDKVTTGLYLDSVFGWHNLYRVAQLAKQYGYVLTPEDAEVAANAQDGDPDFDALSELADDVGLYLDSITPTGFVWRWYDGDFRLDAEDEDE